ncbi:cupin domain-containing protein [Rhizobium grahamii]|uniref:cupin domain-containing protein n=1 Tax=Rhizobium grahamii TaxID=1120045 RepID=UPI0003071F11
MTRHHSNRSDDPLLTRRHGALHSHPHTQVSYVAEGAFNVTVDGITTTLDAGSSFIVAPSSSMSR